MNHKNLIIIFFVFISQISFGQSSTYLEDYIDSLNKVAVHNFSENNIDTVCIYQEYCIGCLRFTKKKKDRCDSDDIFISSYYLWKKDNKTFITKKDNCFDYSTNEILNDSIWSYFFSNSDSLKRQDIKPAQVLIMKDNNEIIQTLTVDHSYFTHISFYLNNDKIISKEIDEYFLEKQVDTYNKENINHLYNSTSKLNLYKLLIGRQIKTSTNLKKLTKTRR